MGKHGLKAWLSLKQKKETKTKIDQRPLFPHSCVSRPSARKRKRERVQVKERKKRVKERKEKTGTRKREKHFQIF